MKSVLHLLFCLASLALNAQNPVYKHWGVNGDILYTTARLGNSYLLDNDRLLYIAANTIRYSDLPDITPQDFISIGSEDDTTIIHMELDSDGNIYLVGNTSISENFTTPGVYKTDYENYSYINNSNNNSFIAKYNAEGILLWRTYIESYQVGGQIRKVFTVDDSGNVYYVALRHYQDVLSDAPFQTAVTDLEINNPTQGSGAQIISKLNANGQLEWQTFFAHHRTFVTSLETTQNKLIVVGILLQVFNTPIDNPNFFSTEGALIEDPLISPTSTSVNRGFINGFNLDGTRDWGTYLNTQGVYLVEHIKTTNDEIYFMSTWNSANNSNPLPLLPNPYLTGSRAHLNKFDENGNHLWSFRTASDNFDIIGKTVIYLFGTTLETTGFVTSDAYQPAKNDYVPGSGQLPNHDAFHHIVSTDGTNLIYGTYYGYEGSDTTGMIWPTPDGYISFENTTQNIVPDAFITQGEGLEDSNTIYGYRGTVFSKFSNQPLSISNQEMKTVKIFPNPFENSIHIENEKQFGTTDEIAVYNELGQHIYSKKNMGAGHSFSIDTSLWSRGFYFVKIVTSGKTAHYKLIKQ